MLPTFGQNYSFFNGTWTTSHQFRWPLFEWLALLIKFAELKYRVKVIAQTLVMVQTFGQTLVLYGQTWLSARKDTKPSYC